jgi:hypothetical protein
LREKSTNRRRPSNEQDTPTNRKGVKISAMINEVKSLQENMDTMTEILEATWTPF